MSPNPNVQPISFRNIGFIGFFGYFQCFFGYFCFFWFFIELSSNIASGGAKHKEILVFKEKPAAPQSAFEFLECAGHSQPQDVPAASQS